MGETQGHRIAAALVQHSFGIGSEKLLLCVNKCEPCHVMPMASPCA